MVAGRTLWQTREGEYVTRAEMQNLYGGGSQGGIEPSATSSNILLYSDKFAALRNGCDFDGWDLYSPRVFHYTGEGQLGDQQFTGGNLASLNHAVDHRRLRLLEAIDEAQRPGGKRHRYVGEFRLDAEAPFKYETATDRKGSRRKLIVFRLIRMVQA